MNALNLNTLNNSELEMINGGDAHEAGQLAVVGAMAGIEFGPAGMLFGAAFGALVGAFN